MYKKNELSKNYTETIFISVYFLCSKCQKILESSRYDDELSIKLRWNGPGGPINTALVYRMSVTSPDGSEINFCLLHYVYSRLLLLHYSTIGTVGTVDYVRIISHQHHASY